jgi:hypothetical protein
MKMKRSVAWIMLVAIGIAIGSALGPYQRTTTAQQPEEEAPAAAATAQLKEINVRLKKLEALLRSGDVRVTVVMNPDVERAKPDSGEKD